jgi:hypothetical protein
MRNCTAIALIFCGTILTLAPTASDLVQGFTVAKALSARPPGHPFAFYRQPLEESYRVGTWLLGGSMVVFGLAVGSALNRNLRAANKMFRSPRSQQKSTRP